MNRSQNILDVNHQMLVSAIDAIRDYAIFLLDPTGVIVTWNDGAERFKGYRASEIKGQHFSKFYPREDVESGKCEYELEEAAKTGRFEDEGWRVRKDGTLFWANVIISAVRDSQGKVIGFSKVTRDLTERKRAEERLRRANEDLERRVEQRTAELSRATKELERALSARDEFLSMASHEIKTPVGSLHLQAQLLLARLEADSPNSLDRAALAKGLQTISRVANRLATLVDYMMDVSRAQLGKFTLRFERVNLSQLVADLVAQWEDPLRVAGSSLALDISPDVWASCDAFRLEQVLSNLISNAIKYAPKSAVFVSLHQNGREATMTVRDAGPGIPTAKLETIFEKFERASNQPGITGFGLGLYIAKSIVEAHHGRIAVESESGRGTSFIVSLPLAVDQAAT